MGRMARMAIDFEAEGLLEGLEGRERESRLELLEELAADGVPLEELRAAVEENRLAVLPVERVLEGEGERYTAREIAKEVGIDLDLMLRNRRALGVPVGDPDEKEATEEDLRATRVLKQFLDAGLPEEGTLRVSRVIGMGMARVAEASRSLFAESLIEPGDTEVDVARRFAALAPQLRTLATPILEYAFRLHLLEFVRRDMLAREDVSAGQLPQTEVTICFADMVGFTKLGERLETEQLGTVAGRLGEMAAETVEPPVRLVKLIGDAAMLVSPEPPPLVESALALVEAADEEGEGFPQLRAGIAHGRAVGRSGDWYGRPVNLASRVTGIARPGSVLATQEARDAIGGPFDYSFAGARRLKGIDGQVKLYRVRREQPSG